MAAENFYNELDLRYMEIGIALRRIDRVNPGKIPFAIPVLTPELDTSKRKEDKIVQRSKSALVNENPDAVEVNDIETANHIWIEIPPELCAWPECEYYVTGKIQVKGTDDTYQHHAGSGVVIEGGSIDVSGTVLKWDAPDTIIYEKSKIFITPTEEWRYYPKLSKWVIAFLGGDINQATVICKLPQPFYKGPHGWPLPLE